MKKMALGLIASMVFLPVISFAQLNTNQAPPASWVAFQKQELAKKIAFFQQMEADRTAFLSANPDVKAYLTQMRAANQTRYAAWVATHPKTTKTLNIP
jgi:hypothetical protein